MPLQAKSTHIARQSIRGLYFKERNKLHYLKSNFAKFLSYFFRKIFVAPALMNFLFVCHLQLRMRQDMVCSLD